MITKSNYIGHIERIGFENLPETLKQAHTVLMTKTDKGKDWSLVEKDPELKKVMLLAFEKLDEFIRFREEGLSGTPKNASPAVKRARQDARSYALLDTKQIEMLYRMEKDAELEDGLTDEIRIRKDALEKELRQRGVLEKGQKRKYRDIRREVDFIHRFIDFHDKVLYKKTFEVFLNELQEAIRKKEITKKSPVAKEIMEIQEAAVKAYNGMKTARHFVLSLQTIKKLKKIIERHENDLDDRHDQKKRKSEPLSGIPAETGHLMCSTDFASMKFDSIGFKDKWLELIGDPSKGFTAMVFGKPKMGKSYLCIDFAGYLARNHGKVLYVAREEKLDATLQKKLLDKDVAHPNLFVADSLPEDLTPYDFNFLDSVNKLGLSPADLDALKAKNPGKSFIFVFQTTKDGNFRGKNEFQHDVDVVIEIPEQGKAVQFGRFNQGGEIMIFEENKGLTEA